MGLYFEEEMNVFYFGMYLIGLFIVSLFRNTTHYKLENDKNRGYQLCFVKRNRTYNYVTDGKNNWKMAGLYGCFVLVVIIFITSIFPKDKFVMDNKYDYLKDDTEEFAQRFAIVGLYGMLFDGGAAGGIDRNRLGTSKYVKFDFEEDLLLYIPDVRKINSVYLKGYVGAVYRDNSWITLKESGIEESTEEMAYINVNTLSYIADTILEENNMNYNYRSMLVNVGARDKYPYVAYYNRDGDGLYTYMEEEDNCQSKFGLNVAQKTTNTYWDNSITYNDAVRMTEKFYADSERDNFVFKREQDYRDYVYEMYMDVPEENSKVIRGFIEEYNLDEFEDKVQGVNEFLESNYEYSLIPGKVPKGKDFVNYFLTENNKGYCTYFASSAVLFYRELGIPARYVGGYAVSGSDITGSEITTDEYYREFVLEDMDESIGVREVEIDDSCAHAWVEVYVDGFGWIPVDPTPPDYDAEEEMQEIAEEESNGAFAKFITTVFSQENTRNIRNTMKNILLVLAVSLVLFVFGYYIAGIYIRNARHKEFSNSNNPRINIFAMKKYFFKIMKVYKCKYEEGMTFAEYADRLKEYHIIDDKDVSRVFEIYEKAKYCEDDISAAEGKELCEIIYGLRDNVYTSLKWYKKFIFKYINLL